MNFTTPRGIAVEVQAGRTKPSKKVDPLIASIARGSVYAGHKLATLFIHEIAQIHRVNERSVYADIAAYEAAVGRGRPGIREDGTYGHGNAAEP